MRRIYGGKEIISDISKGEMCKFLYLSIKNIHFSLNNKIHIQNDFVEMGSPLGLVLANVFMVELETILILNLSRNLCLLEMLC